MNLLSFSRLKIAICQLYQKELNTGKSRAFFAGLQNRGFRSYMTIASASLAITSATVAYWNCTQTGTSCDIKDPVTTEFLSKLRSVIRENQIDTSSDECAVRGKPWNSYHKVIKNPTVIVFPESTEDVSNVIRLCNSYKVPVIPFGGGTSIEGQTLAPDGGLSLDFSSMKKILQLNAEDLDATVQAGIGYIELNEELKDKNIWFPLDPGPGASIGGMCACRCSGSTAVRYGSMRENVLSVTGVLADGTVIRTGGRARKSSAGYDLTRLLIGSEGTLAVITEVTLKLHGIPAISHALRISFPNLEAAAATARDTLNCGVTVGRCELLDDVMIRIINKANHNMQPWPEKITLLYEVTGISTSAVNEQAGVIKRTAERHGGSDITLCTDPEETKELWRIRKECLWSAMSVYPSLEAMITDACVPLSKLPEMISYTRNELLEKSALPAPILAHAGDGNLHVLIMFKSSDPTQFTEAQRLADAMAVKAIALGGTCTGEHGVGTGKKKFLLQEMGPGSLKLMEAIKLTMDPSNILNPGKVLDLPSHSSSRSSTYISEESHHR